MLGLLSTIPDRMGISKCWFVLGQRTNEVISFHFISFICHTHDYNNYKKVYQKKCRKKWRGGLKETIELILIRPPQLQFLEDGTKITATDTK